MGGEILESRVCFKDVGPVTIICPDMRGIGVLQIAVGLMWFGAGRGGRPLSKEVTMEWAIGGGILGGIAVIVWYFFTCFLIPFMSNQIGSI